MQNHGKPMGLLADRRVLLAFAVVAMFVAGYALLAISTSAATSKVVISTDSEVKSGLEDTDVYFVISLQNTDTEYSSQTLKMYANWLSGSGWTWEFTKTDGSALDEVRDDDGAVVDNGIVVAQGATVNLHFVVTIPTSSAGQTQTITLVGVDNFGSFSGNTTRKSDNKDLTVTLASVKGYDVELTVDENSQAGDKLAYSGEDTGWRYTVENTGWETDTFTVTASGMESGWTLNSGLAAGTSISGQSVSGVSHKKIAALTITPASNAKPGDYRITLRVAGAGGSSDSASFTVVLTDPELHVTELSFSHAAAWITETGVTQEVTIYATVVNTGGNVDSNGRAVTTVDVWFTVEGTTVGDIQYIASLKHGEEATVQVTFKPPKDGKLAVQVLVDMWNNQDGSNANDVNIQEENEDNNGKLDSFQAVPSRITGSSFYLSFAGLIAAVAAVVALSSYYHRRAEDDDEE